MPLVEGFGDEVIFILIAFLVGIVVVLAWMSTHVGSRFLVPIIILDQERFSALIHRLRGFAERINEQQRQESAPPTESRPEVGTVGRRDGETDSQIAQAPASLDRAHESELQKRPSVDTGPDSSCRESRDNPVGQGSQMTESPSSSSADNTGELLPGSISIAEAPTQQILGTQILSGSQSSSGHSERSDVSSPEGNIQIRLQYIDGRQRMVSAKLDDTVGAFKRNHFSTELSGNSVVRFVMGGQELRDESSTLSSCGVHDGSVIHCLITQAHVEPVITAADSRHFEIGFLMLPLFGFILTLLWYARISYRSYFSGASTCSLVAISFLYVIILIGSFRSRQVNRPHED